MKNSAIIQRFFMKNDERVDFTPPNIRLQTLINHQITLPFISWWTIVSPRHLNLVSMLQDVVVEFLYLLLKTGVGRCVFNLRFLKSKSFGLVVGQ